MMVQFYMDGEPIALADSPNWVKLLDNGAYGLCDHNDAEGVAIGGVVYNLPGFSIGGVGEVSYRKTSIGDVVGHMASYEELAAAIREGVNAV